MTERTEHGNWERHREEQRRSWLKLSAAQRLRWLEQAKRFAAVALGAARRASRGKRR